MKGIRKLLTASIICSVASFSIGCSSSENPSSAFVESVMTPSSENISLLNFYASQNNKEKADLSKTVCLKVEVHYSEYPEPDQYIYDTNIIEEVISTIDTATVNGLCDNKSSDSTTNTFQFLDKNDSVIFSMSLEDGLLKTNNGRYYLQGYENLYHIDGILMEDGWKEYWEDTSMKASEYDSNYQFSFPSSVFDLGGYYTHTLHESVDASDIVSIRINISWSDLDTFETSDPEVIKSIYEALDAMTVISQSNNGAKGWKWSITFGYKVPNETFYDTCYLSFYGNCFLSDIPNSSTSYAISGLDELLNSADSEVLDYLKTDRTSKS